MKSIINNDGNVAYNVMGDWAPAAFDGAGRSGPGLLHLESVPAHQERLQFLADSFTLPVGARKPDATKAWLKTISSPEGQVAFNTVKGSIPARADLTPEQIKKFSGYQQDAMKSFGKDTIVPSIAHGATVSIKASEAAETSHFEVHLLRCNRCCRAQKELGAAAKS